MRQDQSQEPGSVRKWIRPGLRLSAGLFAGAGLWATACAAQAQSLTTLFSFDGGTYGGGPNSSLVLLNGTLYGTTTQNDSKTVSGTVYSLDVASGVPGLIHAFTPATGDGSWPSSGLLYRNGFFYGVTGAGGNYGNGTVYRINAKTGAESILYSFGLAPDGYDPEAMPVYYKGSLYGTTISGGRFDQGTIYKVDLATGTETVLHHFKATDGSSPDGPLLLVNGLLFGETLQGGLISPGNPGYGTVFSFNPATGTEKMLHRFTAYYDGVNPVGGLVDVGGMLYGVTDGGGEPLAGEGTIFSIDPKTGTYSQLYAFNPAAGDGSVPGDSLVSVNGLLYGTTGGGGSFGQGTIFSFDPASRHLTTLYSFTGGNDGETPAGLLNANGTLFGITMSGGANFLWGTVFQFTP